MNKTARLSDTIHRNKISNFKSIHTDNSTNVKAGKQTQLKECMKAQKIIDLARVRDYDLAELFKYDLTTCSLFDENGLMIKPRKHP